MLAVTGLIFLIIFPIAKWTFSEAILANLVPALLLAAPLLLMPLPREKLSFVKMILNALCLDSAWRGFFRSLAAFLITTLVVFPPFLVAAHFWMLRIDHSPGFTWAPAAYFTSQIVPQILIVALPEELFFRGYMQKVLSDLWKPRWNILGAKLGPAWIVTALLFAFAHSILELKWWHFSIFFPALLFGYLKERCGSITAPVLFHAFCNVFMFWLMRCYFV